MYSIVVGLCRVASCQQITNLRARGLQFLHVPDKYYTNLRERLKHSPVKVEEDIDMVCES